MSVDTTRRNLVLGATLALSSRSGSTLTNDICFGNKNCVAVGQSLPLSGPLSVYAKEKRDGAQLAFSVQNSLAGIGGKTLELITLDDAYDSDRAVANTRKIARDNNLVAFMGYLGVPTVDACLPVFEELRIPAIGLTSGADSVRSPFRKYVFPVRASYASEVSHIVNHLGTLGVERVALVCLDNKLGQAGLQAYRTALNSAKIQVTFEQIVPFSTPNSFRFQELPPESAQVILSFLTAQPMAAWLLSYRGKGGKAPVYGVSIVGANQLFSLAGEAVGNVILSQVLPIAKEISKFKLVRDYLRQVKFVTDMQPSSYGFEAYVEAMVLIEGLKRSSVISPDGLRDALENLGSWAVSRDDEAIKINYDKNFHQGLSYVDLAYIRSNGKFLS